MEVNKEVIKTKRKYVYFSEIERFGYNLQVISTTEKEALEAMKAEYIRVYVKENGCDPREDKTEYTNGKTYWDVFLEELYAEKREVNVVEWR